MSIHHLEEFYGYPPTIAEQVIPSKPLTLFVVIEHHNGNVSQKFHCKDRDHLMDCLETLKDEWHCISWTILEGHV